MDEIRVMFGVRRADEWGIDSQRVRDLKQQIATNSYAVDAPAVADAILSKIRLLKQGRDAASINGVGRSRPAPEGRPGLST